MDASKPSDAPCHSELIELSENYNNCPLVRRLLYNIYSCFKMHAHWTPFLQFYFSFILRV